MHAAMLLERCCTAPTCLSLSSPARRKWLDAAFAATLTREIDARFHLRRADALLAAQRFEDAVFGYAKVARFYTREGFTLKATAVWKQIREIIRKQGIVAAHLDREARTNLIVLYRALGLEEDAKATEGDTGLVS